jgi:hypothetical protein
VPLSDRLTERDIVARAAQRRMRSPLANASWCLLWAVVAIIVLYPLLVMAFALTAPRLPQ